MAFFSVKESEKVPANCSQSPFDRFHGTDDCILNDFTDFPQCSLETQSENLYSLDLAFKTDADPWDNPRFDVSQSAEYGCSIDDKMDGSFFKYFSADHLPEENYRDSILPSYEMPLTDDFESLAMTVDVLDYLEDAGHSFNTTNSSINHNTCCKRDILLSRRECLSEMGNNSELSDEGNICCSQPESSYMEMLQSINSHNWPTDDIQTEVTSAQSNTFETSGTSDKKDITEKNEASVACSGTGQTNWLFMPQQNQTDVSVGQLYNAVKSAPSANENIFTRHSAVNGKVSLLNTSSLKITAAKDCESGHFQQNKNGVEFSGLQPSSSSIFNIHFLKKKNGQTLNQSQEAEASFFTTTAHSSVGISHQWQLPLSSDMSMKVHNTSSGYSDMTATIPLSSTKSKTQKDMDITNLGKHNSVRTSNSSFSDVNINLQNLSSNYSDMTTTMPLFVPKNKALEDIGSVYQSKHNSPRMSNSSFSGFQATKSQTDKPKLVNKKKAYMNVGKKGRFVSVPVEKVNKLMVRDLLTISGNREEMSLKEWTQEYRKNIHKILQQKRKRLNNV